MEVEREEGGISGSGSQGLIRLGSQPASLLLLNGTVQGPETDV